MNKFVTGLILAWLVILTITSCYVVKTEREFLKFADMLIDDNIKNVVKSGGNTYLVVDMGQISVPGVATTIPLWGPVYVNEKDMDKIIEWKRKQTIAVRDFANINFQAPIIAEQAGRYFKQRLAALEKRKPTPKQQDHGAYKKTEGNK